MNKQLKKFLEGTKLTAETLTALLPIIKMVLVAAGVFVMTMMVMTGRAEQREQQYLAEMREYELTAAVALTRADQLSKEVAAREQAAAADKAKADRAAREAALSRARTATLTEELIALKATITDSTQMAREIIPKQDAIIAEQAVELEKKEEQIMFLGYQLTNVNAALVLSTTRGDSLYRTLQQLPKAPAPQKFPKFTRTHAYLLGIATVVIVDNAVASARR